MRPAVLPSPYVALLLAVFAACGPAEGDEVVDDFIDDMDAFAASGKTDTGYVSDQAAEVEAELTSRVFVNLASLSTTERDRLLRAAGANDASAFTLHPASQLRFTRNALKKAKFNANIEGAPAQVTRMEVTRDRRGIWLDYTVKIESLVKNKDLPAGTTVQSLIGKTVTMKLPHEPDRAHVTGGLGCATDPDDPTSTDVSAAPHNFFYYWNPEKPGCALASTAQTGTFRVKNLAPARSTYPEYDRLLSDKVITVVAVFGQLDSGPLSDDDWGWVGFDDLEWWLGRQQFRKLRTTKGRPLVAGSRDVARSVWERRFSPDFTERVTVISPLEIQGDQPAELKDRVLADAFKSNEVIYYNGHSFYGSLKVLDSPANFAPGYQVVFMDSCWSYAYYTKQVFTSKGSAADPTGMVDADVVNNTEVAMSGSHETFFVWLQKLNVAANFVAKKTPGRARNYTWGNLIKYMNTDAKRRFEIAKREGDTSHVQEIYGASGVTTNRWVPPPAR